MERMGMLSLVDLVEKSGMIQIEDVLESRVTEECLSVFNVDGSMRKTAKSNCWNPLIVTQKQTLSYPDTM
jgi:hypothetical protein